MRVRAMLLMAFLAALIWTHWQAYRAGADAELDACNAREQEARDQQRAQADKAAEKHEQRAETIRTEIQTVIREVPRVVEKPVYRNVCFDADGLRLVREAIDGPRAASEPASAVSSPDRPE